MSEFMTKKEVAAYFKVSTRTIDRWKSRGLLKARKLGSIVRFRREDLEAVLKKEK